MLASSKWYDCILTFLFGTCRDSVKCDDYCYCFVHRRKWYVHAFHYKIMKVCKKKYRYIFMCFTWRLHQPLYCIMFTIQRNQPHCRNWYLIYYIDLQIVHKPKTCSPGFSKNTENDNYVNRKISDQGNTFGYIARKITVNIFGPVQYGLHLQTRSPNKFCSV